ncbi:MAG: glycosyltransferase [Nitrospirota bacterium]
MEKKPKILCVTPEVDAPFIINILQPLEILKARGEAVFTVKKEKDALIHDAMRHDIILFFRNSSPARLKLLHFSKLAGKLVIYSVDDNFFELASSEKGPMDALLLDAHSRYMQKSDIVLVYSDPMVEQASRLNLNVIKMLPGGIDFSRFGGIGRRRDKKDKIRIIYATSRFGNDILSKQFLPALKKILTEYKGRVEMDLWGFRPVELEGIPGVGYAQKMDYLTYIKRLYAEDFDIGLAPLQDDLFHRSKTNTKLRDYGACGIAGIYSNVDVYSDCVSDGKTGLLVDNTDDAWYQAMKKLIDDETLRESIKKNAHQYVRTNYDMKATADMFYDIFSKAADDFNREAKKLPTNIRLISGFLDISMIFRVRLKTNLKALEHSFRKYVRDPLRDLFRKRL